MEYRIWNMEYGIWDMGYGIWNVGYEKWNMEYGIWNRVFFLLFLLVFFSSFLKKGYFLPKEKRKDT